MSNIPPVSDNSFSPYISPDDAFAMGQAVVEGEISDAKQPEDPIYLVFHPVSTTLSGILGNLQGVNSVAGMPSSQGSDPFNDLGGCAARVRNISRLTNTGTTSATDTQSELKICGPVYGPEVWKKLADLWGCNFIVADMQIPEPPQEEMKPGTARIYIPASVFFNGEKQAFTLNTLLKLRNCSFDICTESVRKECGNHTAPGWMEIDLKPDPDSLNTPYDTQKSMVENEGRQMPSVLEAAVLNVILFAFHDDEWFYGPEGKPLTFTHCTQKIFGNPVIVGDFGYNPRLEIRRYNHTGEHTTGVVAVRKFQAAKTK